MATASALLIIEPTPTQPLPLPQQQQEFNYWNNANSDSASPNASANSSLTSTSSSTSEEFCDYNCTTSSSTSIQLSQLPWEQEQGQAQAHDQDQGLQQLQLRRLNPTDYNQVKSLCMDWFPVEYPEQWYETVTDNNCERLYSLAACRGNRGERIVGLIVAELKPGHTLQTDDADLIADSQKKFNVAYILSLGVVEEERRHGIASLLLTNLLHYLQNTITCTTATATATECRAVYLHVLTTNTPALRFYAKHFFTRHKFLPYYYTINNEPRDGFTYVLYMNGGHGPGSWIIDYLQDFVENLVGKLRGLWSNSASGRRSWF